ncbi:hypothetical protein K503DRAFT_137517 [Rhizopogon vinicolor AM-OR11-026]|uniref:Uncharacterized protein n=1 Tax=Rhizopogon vinicolor AM-OR11-026 TaxID=1314800 RepID=A0A1B7N1M4_9AGAM|nr:hypothetical protein K503DRAFT_137517 [Rhizopogon vinicolor AM-OR11-026]
MRPGVDVMVAEEGVSACSGGKRLVILTISKHRHQTIAQARCCRNMFNHHILVPTLHHCWHHLIIAQTLAAVSAFHPGSRITSPRDYRLSAGSRRLRWLLRVG